MGRKATSIFTGLLKRDNINKIVTLRDPGTDQLLKSNVHIMSHAVDYYQKLYASEEVDEHAIENLTSNIPADSTLEQEKADALSKKPTNVEIEDIILHTSNGKSPGLDGLPFEVYKTLIYTHSKTKELLFTIMKEAMNGVYPQSWKETRMILLFKKGDPELLTSCALKLGARL